MEAVIVKDLIKKYHKVTVINSLNLSVEDKKCTVILGMDGSGKTTLINLLAENIRKTSGEITYNSSYSFMPDAEGLSEHLTVYENLYLMAVASGYLKEDAKKIIDEYANKFNITERYDDKVKTLSVSLKKLVSYILLLVMNTDIFLLDEPFKGIDVKIKRVMLDNLKELKNKKTIILTTELVDIAKELSDDLYILKDGVLEKIDKDKELLELENKLLNAEVVE